MHRTHFLPASVFDVVLFASAKRRASVETSNDVDASIQVHHPVVSPRPLQKFFSLDYKTSHYSINPDNIMHSTWSNLGNSDVVMFHLLLRKSKASVLLVGVLPHHPPTTNTRLRGKRCESMFVVFLAFKSGCVVTLPFSSCTGNPADSMATGHVTWPLFAFVT